MLPLHALLVDGDGDSLLDSLAGTVYLSRPLTSEHMSAAAELVAWLARDAVCLPLDADTWSPHQRAIFVGKHPPHGVPYVPRGFRVRLSADELLAAAGSDNDLLTGMRLLGEWPLQSTLRALYRREASGYSLSPSSINLTLQDGLAILHLTDEPPEVVNWHELPANLSAVITPTTRYVNAGVMPRMLSSLKNCPSQRFGLGNLFQGGGLFTGQADTPDMLLGSLSIEAPLVEALGVAARLSTEGLTSPQPLTGTAENVSVRVMLEPESDAEIRVCDTEKSSVLEIAGGTPYALAHAATYFAKEFPTLPGGTNLSGVEDDLAAFLNGETPFGRVAMIAALESQLEIKAQAARLPHPPAITRRLLNLPVRNSARDGRSTHWNESFAWEGDRFLEALGSVELGSEKDIKVEGFLSEEKSVRSDLEERAKALFKERNVAAHVSLHSAYKSGLCWLLEEVGPQLARVSASSLLVRCVKQHDGLETEDRWLRELYPSAELLEQLYGVRVEIDLVDKQEVTYRALAFNDDGETLFSTDLTPPTLKTSLNGMPDLGCVYPTTGQVTVRRQANVLLQTLLPTDRDLFWQWFTSTVLPEAGRRVVLGEPGPYFGELSVALSISEPDTSLGLDHEHISATESLHEDIYFGTLEVLHYAAKLDSIERSLAPGRILPFCAANNGKDTRVQVTLREVGSYAIGLLDPQGQLHEATRYPFSIRTTSMRIAQNTLPHILLHLDLDEQTAARHMKERLDWGVAHRDALGVWDPFPRGVRVTIQLHVAGQLVTTVEVPERGIETEVSPLPERPLFAREVAQYAQSLSRESSSVTMRPLRESLHGAPLVALEFTSPTPNASRARLAAWKPTVLVSARQHANEPTSTNAMFRWIERERERGELLKRVNLIFHPVENPDGARLHHALCQIAARHMHHAARYTSVGADLQAEPVSHGRVIPESELRLDTWRRWHPQLHLNCHGYPAHEWVRANGGYVPRHFEAWSLPFGYFTILQADKEHEELLEQLKTTIAEALSSHSHLLQLTSQQVHRALRYLRSSAFPFSIEQGFPFLLTLRDDTQPVQVNPETFNPALVVITEVPDETVEGVLWQGCIDAHQVIAQAVTHTLYGLAKHGV